MIKRGLFISLIFIVGYYVFFGQHGLLDYHRLNKSLQKDKRKIKRLEAHSQNLKKAIKALQEEPFEIEKIARMDYGMGYTNEVVYLLPQK